MSVLSDVTVVQWLLLVVALAAFLGPGLAISAWTLHVGRRIDTTQEIVLGFAVSMALWSTAFGVLAPLNLALPPWAAWLAAFVGWANYGWLRTRRSNGLPSTPLLWEASALSTVLLWLVAAATAVASLWSLAGVVVQPGSDGYHHTLFAQVIAEQGLVPDDLAPLTWLVTFTYHFGYHGFVAVLHWMTGVSVVALTPLAAQVLKVAAALAVAFLTEAIGGRRLGGVVAAAATGLISVFPAYYVNWGRNPQLAGLVILAVLLAVIWLWCSARPAWSTSGLIVLLAIGLALVHYRVTLMAAIGCLVIILAQGLQAHWSGPQWRVRIMHGLAMVAAAVLLALPWIWQVRSNQSAGYPAAIGMPEPAFFRLDRLGTLVLSYPTNMPLLILLGLALGWGLWKRSIGIWVMSIWALLLYVFSQPWAASEYMDTISVVLSLFVPGSVVLGLAAVMLRDLDGGAWRWRSWLVAGLTIALSLWGVSSTVRIVEQGAAYVLPQDTNAVRWVSEYTPEDALFMVNTFAFDFSPEYLIGSDAGGWLPVLAKRRVVTAPMTYNIERSAIEHYPQQLRQLADLSSNLAAPEAVERLRELGITHVFIGQRGGPIAVDKLLESPDYLLDFQDGSVYVFRLLPKPPT